MCALCVCVCVCVCVPVVNHPEVGPSLQFPHCLAAQLVWGASCSESRMPSAVVCGGHVGSVYLSLKEQST